MDVSYFSFLTISPFALSLSLSLSPIPTPAPSPQAAIVVQIAMMTNLNMMYSHNCAESNGWNLAAAINNFRQLRAENKIPDDAYINA